ncbi:MAG TPA: NBR1-Ig-like domain-containing protein [Pyrinomonadaceae bacterium]|nr:NBR1-Ig-like domain-containing protein [Pyrinomonadaceae bacterium]
MRRSALGILLFAALCCFLAPQEAKAQTAYGISAIQYDDARNVVDAYSATELDYYAGYYYDPYVEGYLFRGNTLASSGYSLGYADYIDAVVHTSVTGTPGTQFTLESDHYVVAYYYYYDCYYGCGYYYYDYWGYRFTSGGDYGGYYGFPGFTSPAYVQQQYYYLGSTAVQLTTPSECRFDDDGYPFAPGGGTPCSSCETCQLIPKLEGHSSVTRGDTATFTIKNAARNAQITWQFVSSLGTVSKTGGTTWSGPMAAGGTVSATVVQAGKQYPLTPIAITVNKRDKFALQPLEATKVANGTPYKIKKRPDGSFEEYVLKVPDVPTGTAELDAGVGRALLHLVPSFYTSTIGAGPNQGFKYVTHVANFDEADRPLSPSTYAYVISPALVDTDSEFYKAQCGNYNPLTGVGFISGADLLANTIRHEAGNVESHYRHYLDALKDSAKNPGTLIEDSVAGPAGDINSVVQPKFNAGIDAVVAAMKVEPCNQPSDVTLDANCKKSGNINFAPYQACPISPPGGSNGMSFVSQSVPYSMEAGYGYDVSVTMRNTGTSTWSDQGLFRLGAQNPIDNYTWGLNRVAVPTSVPPGGEVTFNFYVAAPSTPGAYNFQWQMMQDGVGWFGDMTPNIIVDVYSLNYCDWWQEQDCYNRGGSWDSFSCTCYGGYWY